MSKQWIHQAQKEWTDAHDTKQKDRLAWIIRDNQLHHFPLFDETIFINKTTFEWTKIHPVGFKSKEELLLQWAVFMPDMLFPLRNMIIEIDGNWHTNTSKGVKQTKRRNQYYEYAGIKLITFVTKELNKMSDKKLLEVLRSRI